MKVMLRRVKTAEYWSADGGWSTDAERALDFEYVPKAVDYALQTGMKDVRIALYDTGRHADMLLLPSPQWSNQSSARAHQAT